MPRVKIGICDRYPLYYIVDPLSVDEFPGECARTIDQDTLDWVQNVLDEYDQVQEYLASRVKQVAPCRGYDAEST